MIIVVCAFLVLLVAGVPIVFAMGVSAVLTLLTTSSIPLFIIAQRFYAGLDSFTIMAIPFFVMTGLIMETGSIARRIIELATAIIGWVRGSLLMVSVGTGVGLAAISGSGSADTAAVGSMMFPEMRRRKYDIDFSAAIIAAAGALGSVIPPSLIMIVVAVTANVSIGGLFLSGILPGLLIAAGLMLVSYGHAKRGGPQYLDSQPFSLSRLGKSFVVALPAMLIPLIIVGGIVGGIFTATEAACVAVIVGLLISLFIYKEMKFSDLPKLIVRAVGLSAAVMIIIASASILSWLIASLGAPQKLAMFMQETASSKFIFLILITLLLLVVGMFMESMSAVLILVPVLMPAVVAFGIDPLHFAAIVSLNLAVGVITPPYGVCLFVAALTAKRSIADVSSKAIWPLIPMLGVLLLVTFSEEFALLLPRMLGSG